jgi:hypothetical protein
MEIAGKGRVIKPLKHYAVPSPESIWNPSIVRECKFVSMLGTCAMPVISLMKGAKAVISLLGLVFFRIVRASGCGLAQMMLSHNLQ